MIATSYVIKRESRSGKAWETITGIWFPKSQVETNADKTKITAISEWIYTEKFGPVPANAVRVLSQPETTKFFANTTANTNAPQVNLNHQDLSIGVYEKPDGSLWVVKPTRDSKHLEKPRLYAARIVETPSDRLTDAGEKVTCRFDYVAGAIKTLTPEMKITKMRAEQLSIRYGKCIVCGRGLKVAKSVERGMGPVCASYFE